MSEPTGHPEDRPRAMAKDVLALLEAQAALRKAQQGAYKANRRLPLCRARVAALRERVVLRYRVPRKKAGGKAPASETNRQG